MHVLAAGFFTAFFFRLSFPVRITEWRFTAVCPIQIQTVRQQGDDQDQEFKHRFRGR